MTNSRTRKDYRRALVEFAGSHAYCNKNRPSIWRVVLDAYQRGVRVPRRLKRDFPKSVLRKKWLRYR